MPHAPRSRASSDPGPLGANLRRLRAARGWTLADTAKRTGLSVATLSKAENGLQSLTFDNLARVAAGFRVSPSSLFAPAGKALAPAMVLTRRGQGVRHTEAGFEIEYLCAGSPGRHIMPMLTRVKARTIAAWGPALRHPGEEVTYVLRGSIDFQLEGEEKVRLSAGDCVSFDSSRAHAAAAVGRGDALLLSAILPHEPPSAAPGNGSGRKLRHEVTLERPVGAVAPRAGDRDGGKGRRGRPRRVKNEHR